MQDLEETEHVLTTTARDWVPIRLQRFATVAVRHEGALVFYDPLVGVADLLGGARRNQCGDMIGSKWPPGDAEVLLDVGHHSQTLLDPIYVVGPEQLTHSWLRLHVVWRRHGGID